MGGMTILGIGYPAYNLEKRLRHGSDGEHYNIFECVPVAEEVDLDTCTVYQDEETCLGSIKDLCKWEGDDGFIFQHGSFWVNYADWVLGLGAGLLIVLSMCLCTKVCDKKIFGNQGSSTFKKVCFVLIISAVALMNVAAITAGALSMENLARQKP